MLEHHYLIVGAASKTGQSVIQFMSYHKLIYSVSDNKPNFMKSKIYSNPPRYIYDSFEQNTEQLKNITHIVISPGYPRSSSLLQEAKKKNIPIDTDISFAYNYLKKIDKLPYFIGITGSNGKSTTCSVLYKILQKGYSNGRVFLLGNFGTPILSQIQEINSQDIVILELSSYHLEDAEKYHLNACCILNISKNHLDRYDSYEAYQKTKEKIFLNQTNQDMCVINKDIPEFSHFLETSKAEKIIVSSTLKKDVTVGIEQNSVYYKENFFLNLDNIRLKQPHMISNLLFAIAFSKYLNIEDSVIRDQISSFKGLEHRSEFVITIDGISFINDSKATTPTAVIPNLSGFKSIILILGGLDKNLDFTILNKHLKNVKHIIFYGKSGLDIQKQVDFHSSTYLYDFKESVLESFKIAKNHTPSTVLLSTGCASFDQFESYEQRGKYFKQIVYEIQQ